LDRCVILVDAGHLLAEGGKLCCGTKRRTTVKCDYPRLLPALEEVAQSNCQLPVLRTYWYDGARDALPTLDHLQVAQLNSVKLRLGRLSAGKQKGVDALIYRDLMTLARERAVATAFLLGGDDDLREGVTAAQDMGVRVVVLGVEPTDTANQAETLIREADEHVVLGLGFLSTFFTKTETARVRQQPTLRLGVQEPTPKPEEVGRDFARSWLEKATALEVRELAAQAPVVPKELDVQLVVSAESALHRSLRGRSGIKSGMRRGFWECVREAADKLPPESAPSR